jgi:hypothetical protein
MTASTDDERAPEVAARPWRDHVALAVMAALEAAATTAADQPATPVAVTTSRPDARSPSR